ncbi:MAG: response regulator transcription factor [Acidimicrobiia bacterium]
MTEPIRVVLADDHALVREGTSELLAKHPDIEVVATAEDGTSAVELIDKFRPDVALVDISMPGLTGIEVTREVKSAFPEVAILILTVHDEDVYVRALLEAGAAGYLLKDIGEAELVRSIRAVHSGESVLHPKVTRALFESLIAGADGATEDASPLTDREDEVLRLAAQGQSNKQIAAHLDVSPRTVQTHLGHIFEKLGVASRTEAVIRGLRQGWLLLDEL